MFVYPVTLQKDNIRLEPLGWQHLEGIKDAVKDGELWKITVTSAPEPEHAAAYINDALRTANRFAFAVINIKTGQLIGTTSYHDIVAETKRVEIGYTWYRQSVWRTHVNTTCKLLLLEHAFETLGCPVVGWRTDNENYRSQAAIERLGATRDGVIRGHVLRRDGTIRDTIVYSMLAENWAAAKQHLLEKLAKYR